MVAGLRHVSGHFSESHCVMVQISMKKVEGLCFTLLTLERLASLSAVIQPQSKGPARWGDILVASLKQDLAAFTEGGMR